MSASAKAGTCPRSPRSRCSLENEVAAGSPLSQLAIRGSGGKARGSDHAAPKLLIPDMTSTNSRLALALVVSSTILSGSMISAQPAAPQAGRDFKPAGEPLAPPQPPQRPQFPTGPVEVNGIAAKVNGRVVTKNQ